MKTRHLIYSFIAFVLLVSAAFGADLVGTWKWTTTSPNGDIPTTLKFESKDGKLVGAYSNQFGDAMISNLSVKGDMIAFDVVRDLNGDKYVVKYHGKIDGDTIKGKIEAPGFNGSEGVKLDWNAKRAAAEHKGT